MKKTNPIQQAEAINISSKSTYSFSDYIALFFVIALLYVDFLPAFRSIDILGTQFLYMAIINFIVCLYLFTTANHLTVELFTHIKRSWFIKFFGLFLICAGLSVFGANNFSLWVVNFSHVIIVAATIFNLIILFYGKTHLIYQVAFFFSVSVFAQCFSQLYGVFHNTKLADLATQLATMKGNTGNINIFSASVNVKIPFLILGLLYFKNWKQWFSGIALFFGTTVVLLLGSRASYLGLIFEIIFIVFYLFYKTNAVKQNALKLCIVVLPMILSLLFVNVLANTNKSALRSSGITGRLASISDTSKGSSVWSRLKYWENGGKMIAKHPIFGVGIGNWRIESLPYETQDFDNLMISEHAHNDIIEVTAESGILAGLAYTLMFILLFFINFKIILQSDDIEKKLVALTAILIFIGYIFDCLFNFPLHRPTIQVCFSFMLMLTFINACRSKTFQAYSWKKPILILSAAIILFSMYFTYCAFEAYRLENDITADIQSPKDQMTSAQIKDRLPRYPNVFTNSEPFTEQLGIYLVNEKKYAEAHKYLNEANEINPYNGRVEWYKHRIAKETNKKDSAYIYAKQAFEIRPRNYDYFISMLFMANEFKDTTEMLRVHKKYHGFIKKPKNWIDTSNALHLSNYNKKNILDFINQGFKEFPNDSLLIDRKKVFEYEFNAGKPNATFQISDKKPVTATEKYLYFLQLAVNYGAQNNFVKALECYKEVLKTDPKNITIVQNIGICYFKINQFQKAIVELEKTIGSPMLTDGKSEYILGVCNINLQKKAEGCKYLKLAAAKKFAGADGLLTQYCK